MVAFRSAAKGSPGGALAAHAVAFASPQALFPVLSLFMLLDPFKYQDYAPLYLTGKLVSAIAVTSWLAASFSETLVALELTDAAILSLAVAGAFSAVWDFVSVALTFFFLRTTPSREDSTYRPELVVDSVDADLGGK
ncbi:MAG: hypothetical protein A2Z99_15485 [Treponema sp. GWB1_62_6]|nr:MAG: hypothetical protein A2001_21125 [Treponema sp. GWC1_61_84]OHE71555.1 MAG: hypothetical protein A2Z99_15485 [Treponema sp. GWB1_62_6]OHE76129.1 MAG: hypothetical protein A2413_13970 [Treponema sp. RIFOXYC1_FULL_61_9]HCM26646.1 hypothetical protein [Treponema sp.]